MILLFIPIVIALITVGIFHITGMIFMSTRKAPRSTEFDEINKIVTDLDSRRDSLFVSPLPPPSLPISLMNQLSINLLAQNQNQFPKDSWMQSAANQLGGIGAGLNVGLNFEDQLSFARQRLERTTLPDVPPAPTKESEDFKDLPEVALPKHLLKGAVKMDKQQIEERIKWQVKLMRGK